MASPSVISTLDRISSHPTTDQPAGYTTLLNSISSNSPPSPTQTADLTTTITSILSSPLGIVALRPLLTTTITTISSLPTPHQIISTGTHLLTLLEPRAVSFEEADSDLRHTLANAHESQDDWSTSARTLQGINLESSQRQISEHAKVSLWIRICRLYLEDDDTTTAESYLNRAKNLLYRVTAGSAPGVTAKDTEALTINFQLCQARILDAQRRFLDASTAYHNISYNTAIDESERLHTLAMAITCAVLAGAGPARARGLGRLYKDERAGQVSQYGMLEKMFLDRLLGKEEVEQFAAGLSPHQVARTGDGQTVLGKAVVEHNLLSASRVYENIGLGALAGLLGFEGEGVAEGEGGWERAEAVASGMLQQGRLGGRIDQIEGVIHFGEGGKDGGTDLSKWDCKVRGLAEDVERVASLVQMEYPEWSQANMVH